MTKGPFADLIAQLTSDLQPVRRLAPPWLRALAWTAAAGGVAILILAVTGAEELRARLVESRDLSLAALGSALTAFTAAWAVFALSVPGSRRAWALLPLPALLLWIGASGAGCLRTWIVPGTREPAAGEMAECLALIVGGSLPLAALLFVMVRRAMPMDVELTGTLGGLAAAGAAATLLSFFHPFDAAFLDLLVHAVAVLAVVMASRSWATRSLEAQTG
jgi:hypothetical protein